MNEFDTISYCIGASLKQLRLDAGYKSYEQFAFEYKLSRIQYWKMENGNNFTLKSLLLILNIHQVDFNSFFDSIKRFVPKETNDTVRLTQIMNYAELDKNALSKKLGYKNLTIINHVLLGGKEISAPLARKIKREFPDINLSWVLNGEGDFITN